MIVIQPPKQSLARVSWGEQDRSVPSRPKHAVEGFEPRSFPLLLFSTCPVPPGRNPPPGERDVSSVTSFSLPSLRAMIMLEDPGMGAIEGAPERGMMMSCLREREGERQRLLDRLKVLIVSR